MHIKDYLATFLTEVEPVLEDFFSRKIKETKKISPQASDLVLRLKNLNEGGKKIRGALLKLGYQCAGGKEIQKILPACVAMEILNTALLIHDDIIDQADLRRGKPTIHRQYEELHRKNQYFNNASHYGQSIAIVAGDIGIVSCFELITGLKLPSNLILKALLLVSKMIQKVGYGEVLDVNVSCHNKATQEEILQIYTLKTAWYTTTGPMQLGAILVGADSHYLSLLQNYAQPLGLAFQLKDDILGMFGNEEELGKPVLSDMRERKKTFLFLKTDQKANTKQRQILQKLYGNPEADEKDLKAVQELMIETGALAECENLAAGLIQEAKHYIPKITSDRELLGVLSTLADFIVERNK